MIYTLTLNPSIDYDMELGMLVPGSVNRARETHLSAGGKGINVSVVLSALGIRSTILGFVAGFTGLEIEKSLKRSGFSCDFVHLSKGMSRINVKLHADSTTDLNAPGPRISQPEFDALLGRLDHLTADDILVLAGSVPAPLPEYVYRTIMDRVADKGVRVFVDAERELLLPTLSAHPYLIKPNRHELGEIFSVRITTPADAERYAFELCDMGARNVLVSLDRDGAVFVSDDGTSEYVAAPAGQAVNPVGAGDSMVAGIIYGLSQSFTPDRLVRIAVAAGSASAFSSALAGADDIMSLYRLM